MITYGELYHSGAYEDACLMHYGIKGMKWGVRRAQSQLAVSNTRKKFDSTKADYKSAKKAYAKAYNKAYNYSYVHPITQFTSKKRSAEANRRWDDAVTKAENIQNTKKAYKQAKAERKQAIKDTHAEINKKASIGDKLIYDDATRARAAKYVVDNNMSMDEANKRAKSDAKRNTAIILGAYGAIAVAGLYKANR